MFEVSAFEQVALARTVGFAGQKGEISAQLPVCTTAADIILLCIRWYAVYPLSYRHLEEIMHERGISVHHSTVNQWAIRFLPLIEKLSREQSGRSGRAGK